MWRGECHWCLGFIRSNVLFFSPPILFSDLRRGGLKKEQRSLRGICFSPPGLVFSTKFPFRECRPQSSPPSSPGTIPLILVFPLAPRSGLRRKYRPDHASEGALEWSTISGSTSFFLCLFFFFCHPAEPEQVREPAAVPWLCGNTTSSIPAPSFSTSDCPGGCRGGMYDFFAIGSSPREPRLLALLSSASPLGSYRDFLFEHAQ